MYTYCFCSVICKGLSKFLQIPDKEIEEFVPQAKVYMQYWWTNLTKILELVKLACQTNRI